MVDRRAALRLLTGGVVSGAVGGAWSGQALGGESRPDRLTGMGLVLYDCNIRRRWMREKDKSFDLFEPLNFLKYCHSLGAGGMQARLGVLNSPQIDALRNYAQDHDLYVDAIIGPPRDQDDVSRFEAEVQTAQDVGVQAARTTIIPGRRYERFDSLEEFRQYERRGRQMLERAVPIVEKRRVPLAVENHKDQRIDERLALLRHLESEFIGACVDTGNSFALLDGAYEPIAALAPYAKSVHLKDQALQGYADGFLLGDIPLGQGSFDLKRMVGIIRQAQPELRISLELITRDPLKVPCLTERYYQPFGRVSARDLARTMRFVHAHAVDQVQNVSSRSIEEQVGLEDANINASLKYAGSTLGI